MSRNALIWTVVAILIVVGGIILLTSDTMVPENNGPVACTLEAKMCPDGSAVGRTGPNCEFAACPVSTTTPSTSTTTAPTPPNTVDTPAVAPKTITVTYTDSGFSPAIVNIKRGDTVTFINQGTGSMWVGSNDHPSHTIYSGTSLTDHCSNPNNAAFDQCTSVSAGASWSFKFDKAGTWNYHNHRRAAHGGTVVVQ
jgi:plastocyanin